MEIAGSKKDSFIDFRQHARLRIPVPFACSISRKGASRWFAKERLGPGVVYDVSMKGARVSSEALFKPGDQVMVTMRLPKQIEPLAVSRATVRWTKNQTFGLEFMHLTFAVALQLKRFIARHAMPTQ
jgi:PilZ domain-containing protein